MNIKSLFLAILIVVAKQPYAGNLYKLSNESLKINRCDLVETGNTLDLALSNDGYFVVSQGKKNRELFFTRFGQLFLDMDGYMRTSRGDYLLGINKKSDPNKLSKLKISTNHLPPKATTKVNLVVNLPAIASDGDYVQTNGTLYDSISASHVLTIKYTKINFQTWDAQVFVDDIKLNKGKLIFKPSGELSNQEGLSHNQWPTNYGLNDLNIDHSSSTAYASSFYVQSISHNGYSLGALVALTIDQNGGIFLMYDNGQHKELKNHIAVAKFTNPNYLEFVTNHLYRPTAKSGPQRLHRMNSQYAVLSGVLEQEPCVTNK
ncbi:hypothetical protein TUM19329_17340 [Legionella antarctica]|uniref:Flagellar hook protein FlgE D2 domain-containing protein n=1 Tax=Legionella antarctica TaxID=2708020 RepID=A0A6F8T589_9GAMM|nr:flagellar hook-basal body complex protein [Legionella antarctica]BCA95373.1 hypothetical protein TUM19329_17340 [Legionella antarctica]